MLWWLYIVSALPLSMAAPPFLFPHGYFDSSKLQPFDAIYLNMMAQSNLEYGGVTLEELDALDSSRKAIPRLPAIGRTREEDDHLLDRAPTEVAEQDKDKILVQDHQTNEKKPQSPFSRIRLAQRTLRDSPIPSDDPNPFEEIATRAPPRSINDFRAARRHLRRGRRNRHKTRRTKKGKSDNAMDEERFSLKRKQEEISIELDAEPKRKHRRTSTQTPPTLIPMQQQDEQVVTSRPKIRRLPNNPFRDVDLSKPTVLKLAVPPGEAFESEFN